MNEDWDETAEYLSERYADDLAWEAHRGRTEWPVSEERAPMVDPSPDMPRWQRDALAARYERLEGDVRAVLDAFGVPREALGATGRIPALERSAWDEVRRQWWRAVFPPPVRIEWPVYREEFYVRGSASPYLRSSGARPSPWPRPDRPDVYRRPSPREDVERDTLAVPEGEPEITWGCRPPVRRGGTYEGLRIGVDPSMPPGTVLFLDAQNRVLAPSPLGLDRDLRIPWWTFDRRRADDPERPSAWEQIMTNRRQR